MATCSLILFLSASVILKTLEELYNIQGKRKKQADILKRLFTLAIELNNASYQSEIVLKQANYAEAIGNYEDVQTCTQQIKMTQKFWPHFQRLLQVL